VALRRSGSVTAAGGAGRRNSAPAAIVDAPAHLLCGALQRAQSSGTFTTAAATTTVAGVGRRNTAVVDAPAYLLCSTLQRTPRSAGSSATAAAAAATAGTAGGSTGIRVTTATTTATAAIVASSSSSVQVVIGDKPYPHYSADAGWLAACPNATATAMRSHSADREAYSMCTTVAAWHS
jgi:hypothetical protein